MPLVLQPETWQVQRVLVPRRLGVQGLVQLRERDRLWRCLLRDRLQEVRTRTSLLDRYEVSSLERYLTLNAAVGKAYLLEFSTSTNLVDLLY